MKSDNLRCGSFFYHFFDLDRAQKKKPLNEEYFGCVIPHKQKTVNGCGPFNKNLGIFAPAFCYNHPFLSTEQDRQSRFIKQQTSVSFLDFLSAFKNDVSNLFHLYS